MTAPAWSQSFLDPDGTQYTLYKPSTLQMCCTCNAAKDKHSSCWSVGDNTWLKTMKPVLLLRRLKPWCTHLIWLAAIKWVRCDRLLYSCNVSPGQIYGESNINQEIQSAFHWREEEGVKRESLCVHSYKKEKIERDRKKTTCKLKIIKVQILHSGALMLLDLCHTTYKIFNSTVSMKCSSLT